MQPQVILQCIGASLRTKYCRAALLIKYRPWYLACFLLSGVHPTPGKDEQWTKQYSAVGTLLNR
jgi:hypothetical protein